MKVISEWILGLDINDYLTMILLVCVAITLYLRSVDKRIQRKLTNNKELRR